MISMQRLRLVVQKVVQTVSDAGFIIGSYLITLGAIGAFAFRTIRLGRKLANEVPDEEKPWL